MLQLSGQGSLEGQLKAALPDWQQALANLNQQSLAQPQCLIVSGAALGAIDLMRKLPSFNQVGHTSRWCFLLDHNLIAFMK